MTRAEPKPDSWYPQSNLPEPTSIAINTTDHHRIVITGLIGSIPLAGLTLHYLQYVLGLRALGFEVLYLEDTGSWYYDPETDSMVENVALPLEYLDKTMAAYGMDECWTFVDHRGQIHGQAGRKFEEFLRTSTLFINVTGAGLLRDSYRRIPHRAYVDTDPGYIQMRIANGSEKDLDHLRGHTSHFSFGCNIGLAGCRIPTVGFSWRPTVQPLCLELWPVWPPATRAAPFTTVLKWQTYDPVEYEGETYGLKDVEFVRFQDLPRHCSVEFELAMSGAPPLKDLHGRGWRCRPALAISKSIEDYQNYIRGSRGEWGVAKNGYVKMQSGWFGDRSASYLASGRPVLMQSTGFENWLPTGSGVMPFSSIDECLDAIRAVEGNYPQHCRTAREIAGAHFDASKVLTRLVEEALQPTASLQPRRTN